MAQHEGVSGLEDHLGYWLRRLSDEAHTTFERRLAARGVTVSQWCVLVAVYHGATTTPLEVAHRLAIDSGAVTRLTDRLIAKGLLRREADLADRRSVRLALTDAGRDLVPDLAALADANDTAFFGVLAADERRQFARLLVRLLAARGIEATSRWQEGDAEGATPEQRGAREGDET